MIDCSRSQPATLPSAAWLVEHLRCCDRVGLEDPGFGNIHDLVISRGLSVVPVATDDSGMVPESLERAIAEGIRALVVTPRAQNPTGAAMTEERARALRRVLRKSPDLLTFEDDHAALITDAPLHTLHTSRSRRWVYLRSLSKALNPDLRLALMTGDDTTMTRVRDRLMVGERWVSHILQRIAGALLDDAEVRSKLKEVGRTYGLRRRALIDRLAEAGIFSTGRSGYNVWIPVAEETPTVQALLARGWAVGAGERFRIQTPPAIRVTAATLLPEEAAWFAADLADILTAGPCAGAA
jgi:DNA-binding transcriptional MocR family regulator